MAKRWVALSCFVVWFLSSMEVACALQESETLSDPYTAHYRPADHAIGDVHPFFSDGVCHLFYLKPNGYHAALVESSDWVNWTEVELPRSQERPADQVSPYFVLGVFRDDSGDEPIFRSYFGHRDGEMRASESRDLHVWQASSESYLIPGEPQAYRRRRDPFVFWNDVEQRYWCVMTTQLKTDPIEQAGAISFATSTNLNDWRNEGLLFSPGNIGEPECPQMIHEQGRWYLFASIYERAVGQPRYWMSDSPRGPWKQEIGGVLDGKDLCAAQVVHDGSRWLLFGWIPQTPSQPGKQAWGGHLALVRELRVRPDGHWDVRLLPEFTNLLRGNLTEALVADHSKPIVNQTPSLSSQVPQQDACWWEVNWETSAEQSLTETSLQLKVNAVASDSEQNQETQTGPITIKLEPSRLSIIDDQGTVWSELSIELESLIEADDAKMVSMKCVIDRDIIEVFVGDRYSLAARVPSTFKTFELSAAVIGADAQNLIAGNRLSWEVYEIRKRGTPPREP